MRKIILLSALIYCTAVFFLGGQLQYESLIYETKEAKVSLVPLGDTTFIIPSYDIPVFIDLSKDSGKLKGATDFLSSLYTGHLLYYRFLALEASYNTAKGNPLFIIFRNLRL